MIAKIESFTITSIEEVVAFAKNGDYLFTLDELTSISLANSQESVEVRGKKGRLINSLKRNKSCTITGQNGLLSMGLLAADAGAAVNTKDCGIMWFETLLVDSGKASTTFKAVGTTGAEISSLFIKDPVTGVRMTKLEQAATAQAGKFAYDPATKELSFHTDVTDGTSIIVYYNRKINAQIIQNNANSYTGKVTLYVTGFCEDACNNVFKMQIIVPTADFSGNFSIEAGDTPATHSFEAQALAAGCTSDGSFWDFIIYGTDEQDVV